MAKIKIKDTYFDLNEKTHIMGILNVTPDSFSDGGQFTQVEKAVEHARILRQEGADMIDIGGESTRPGHTQITIEEEIQRVLPVIKAVRKALDIPISIDTYKSKVAELAIDAGANMINDIWGAKKDRDIASLAAERNVPIVLMHNREEPVYHHFLDDILRDLTESINIAKAAGVSDEQIILDPGIGFGKTYEQNLIIMRHLHIITKIGYPVLLGTSRKSLVGKTLNLPVEERIEGTGATVCLGIERGCQIVRVHDVKPIARMTKMMDAMLKGPVSSG